MPAQQPPKNQSSAPAASAPAAKGKAKPEPPKIVRVRATRLGFGPISPSSAKHSRIKAGTVFNFALAPGRELPKWLEEVDENNNPLDGFAEEQQSGESDADKSGSGSDNVI